MALDDRDLLRLPAQAEDLIRSYRAIRKRLQIAAPERFAVERENFESFEISLEQMVSACTETLKAATAILESLNQSTPSGTMRKVG